jgi:flavin reductase (DIM6/NTAB) family NADH-FMN oxidoreductase RutF
MIPISRRTMARARDCCSSEVRDSGLISADDHVIVTGEVRALESREGDPLVFHAGDYRPLR